MKDADPVDFRGDEALAGKRSYLVCLLPSEERYVGFVAALSTVVEQLQLSDDERGEVIGQLLRSLEPADGEDLTADERLAAWSGELGWRAREVHDGAVTLINGDEALAGVRSSIHARCP